MLPIGFGGFDLLVDGENGKLYWTENNISAIQRSNLDGTDFEQILSDLAFPSSIALLYEQPSAVFTIPLIDDTLIEDISPNPGKGIITVQHTASRSDFQWSVVNGAGVPMTITGIQVDGTIHSIG